MANNILTLFLFEDFLGLIEATLININFFFLVIELGVISTIK